MKESFYFQIKEEYDLPKEKLATKSLELIEHLNRSSEAKVLRSSRN